MASTLRNGSENIPAGTAPTSGNSGGGSATAFNNINIASPAAVTSDTTHPAHGANSFKIVTGASVVGYVGWTYTGVAQRADHAYVYLTANPPVALAIGMLRSAGGRVCTAIINSSGQLVLQDASATNNAHVSTNHVPLSSLFRVEWGAKPGTSSSNGSLFVAMYDNTETLIDPIYSRTDQNAGTAVIVESRFGLTVATSGLSGTFWMDDLESSDQYAYGPIGPFSAVAPVAPTGATATAGAFSATVSWTASSYDGDSPITKYRVTAYVAGSAVATQDTADGSTVSLVFTGLAAGTSYTFTVHATNAIGDSTESSATSSVQVTGALQTVDLISDGSFTAGTTSSLGTSPLCLAANEEPVDDTNYILSPVGGGVYIGKLAPFDPPADNNNYALKTRAFFLNGATSGTVKCEIFQGAPPGLTGGTAVAASGNVAISATVAEYVFTLTPTQGANITDPTNVYVRYTTVAS